MKRRLSWYARTWVLRKYKHPVSRCYRHNTERTRNPCWGSVHKDKAFCMWHLITYFKDCIPSVIRKRWTTEEKWFGGFQNTRNNANKYSQIKVVLSILIISFTSVTTEGSLPRRRSSKKSTMEAQIEEAYWTWKFEVDKKLVVAIIFNKNWLCKVPLILRKLKCSEELQVFLMHWKRFPDSRLLEAPHSFSRYSAEIVHINNIVTFSFWFHLTAFCLQTTRRALRPQTEDPWMVGMMALEVLNLTPTVLLPSRLHWRISACR